VARIALIQKREIAIAGPIGYATTDVPIFLLATERAARSNKRFLAPARGPARMTNLWKNTGLWMRSKP
jgi:hypothetical protein